MLDGKNLLPYILEDKSDLREFRWRKRARNHDAGINFLNNEAYRYGDWKKEVVNTKDPVYIPVGKDQYGNGR